MSTTNQEEPHRPVLPTDWEVSPIEDDEGIYALAYHSDLDRPDSFLHIKKRHVQAVRKACGRNNFVDFALYAHLCNLSMDGSKAVTIKAETLASDLSLSDLDNVRKHLNFLHNSGLITKTVETHRLPIREKGRIVAWKEKPTSRLCITVHVDHPAAVWAKEWELGMHSLDGKTEQAQNKKSLTAKIEAGFAALKDAVEALDSQEVANLMASGGFEAVLALATSGRVVPGDPETPVSGNSGTEAHVEVEKASESPSRALNDEVEALMDADLKRPAAPDDKYRAELSAAWEDAKASNGGISVAHALAAYENYLDARGYLRADGDDPRYATPLARWLAEPSGLPAYLARLRSKQLGHQYQQIPDTEHCPLCGVEVALINAKEKRYDQCANGHGPYRLSEIEGMRKRISMSEAGLD